ncbi:IPT/TIG domain-containing protein [Curtobacterium sp. ME12]|uniref:IPT/TIG domain-containing protein n=1 Tax=Curtobacterium sp. ME12 TaxID=2744253 RepID=UPI0015F6DD90|nr:IPT/TIG domain-containing protein [Curtobacterium sp. ME12]
MQRRMRMHATAMALAAGTVLGGSILIAGPASAAPGDASATGISAAVDVPALGDLLGLTVNAAAGDVAVAGNGADGFDGDATTLVNADVADIGADVVSTSVSSNTARSTASSDITGASAALFGSNVLSAAAVTATATCPVGGTPTGDATLTGLTLLGQAVTLNADTPTLTASTALTGDLADVTLTVNLIRSITTTATTAATTSVLATVTLNGTAGDVTLTDDTVATIVLAEAACETPTVAPAVQVTDITPGSGPTTGGQTVIITGSGFGDDTTVTFGGVPATGVTVAADGESLTAVTPAGTAGPTTVVVANGGSSDTLPYTYVAPAVTRLAPARGPVAGGNTVTITGTGLQAADEVRFGGTPAVIRSISDDGTRIVVSAPAGTGLVDVTVGFPGDTSLTAPAQYRYVAPAAAAATVTGVSPASGPTSGGQTVVITGTGLADVTEVTIGGNPATIVGTPTNTRVSVSTPAGAAGAADVVVTDANESTAARDLYTYVPAPTTTGVTPGTGSVAGGTVVTVNGDGFVPGGTTVTLCGVTIAPADVTVSDGGTRATFSTPPCDVGATPITVATAGGSNADASFQYVDAGDAASGGVGGTPVLGAGSDGTLAYTGADPRAPLAAAIALLLLGTAAALTGRRFRRRSA